MPRNLSRIASLLLTCGLACPVGCSGSSSEEPSIQVNPPGGQAGTSAGKGGSPAAGAGGAQGGTGNAGGTGQGGAAAGGISGTSGQGGTGGAEAGNGGSPEGGASGEAGQGGEGGTSGGQGSSGAGAGGGSGAGGGGLPACDCFAKAGWCGAGVLKEAAKLGCTVPIADKNKDDLMICVGGKWTVKEVCSNGCEEAPPGTPDSCKPKPVPVCDCFVQSAWCGTGAAKEAEKMGCSIPLLPEHNNDILYCPGGKWSVKQECPKGCIEAPAGTPDSCKGTSDYRLPFDCGTSRTCSNGNGTSTHTGKDQYAFDFAMPTGTTVRAMRGGKVLQVRNVSQPGDPCYSSGNSSCANLANTVEILHTDGTVGLYMHLSKGTVTKGQSVNQGDVLGKSGNSGWSTGPHLHVQVQQNCGIWWCQSVPFKFVEDSTISAGTSVKSQNCP